MITGAIITLVAAILDLLLAVLPTTSLGVSTSVPGYVSSSSGVLGFLDQFIPVSEMLTALGFVLTVWLPAVIVYQTSSWIYRHIPFVGGG